MNILHTENITKNYSGHRALNNVSISIPEKSIYGLLGPNGAGKTSLLRIITQITMPDSGLVYFKNEKLSPNHGIQTGYLPEERGLYKKMNVEEQLIYLGRLKGLSQKDARLRAGEWLQKLELDNWAKHPVEDLSKGMQQKVQFIAAVLHEPSFLILDEPFTGFDPINAEMVKNEILKLKDKGTTIILSTHRMESIEELCDHIALINRSEKILEGPVSEVKNKYKKNIYVIEGKGILPESSDYKILSTETKAGIHKYRIQSSSLKENAILKKAMETMTIFSFNEETPTVQDIFINLVKGEKLVVSVKK